MLRPDFGDEPIHPFLHLLRRLSTRMFFARRTPVRPNPPVGLTLLDLRCQETFVRAVIPFGDLFRRLERDRGRGLGVVLEELRGGSRARSVQSKRGCGQRKARRDSRVRQSFELVDEERRKSGQRC